MEGLTIGKTGSTGSGTSIMDPPLLRRKLRVAKRRKKGGETNIRLLLLRATTSHIRNNSPDYFPLTIYSNLLEKLVKHRLHTTPPYCTLLLAYIFPLPLVLSRAYRRDTRWRIDDPSSKNSIRPCSKAGDASFSLSSTMERDFRVGTVLFCNYIREFWMFRLKFEVFTIRLLKTWKQNFETPRLFVIRVITWFASH